MWKLSSREAAAIITMDRDAWEAEVGWILEAVLEARVIVDRAGRIVFVKLPTAAWFGYRRDELIGQTVEILVPERHRDAHSGSRASFTARPHPRPMGAGLELYARRKDGTEFPVDISLWPLEREGGPFILAAVRDMTEHKRLLAQLAVEHRELVHARLELKKTAAVLKRSNADLEQFAYVASVRRIDRRNLAISSGGPGVGSPSNRLPTPFRVSHCGILRQKN